MIPFYKHLGPNSGGPVFEASTRGGAQFGRGPNRAEPNSSANSGGTEFFFFLQKARPNSVRPKLVGPNSVGPNSVGPT